MRQYHESFYFKRDIAYLQDLLQRCDIEPVKKQIQNEMKFIYSVLRK
ncbi:MULTISPECIES: hypothetical protein [Virgibacillus]|uniref:Uncharacterized protein n=1 Tax=Virgibacillus massiliensis TaxID=1462526 RepID=A0A024QHF7_9BACI|nr:MULTISPECIES: hypothetical protein [Virgibacillus]EQB34661.1 hypothetical protein M948_19945 [Virgibacillus sp. CM-4]MYL43681.1 hypothetical protein [Virgibacillus massiliensis]CDQ41635.1 hypothetical protein BN990_04009 [Virgibacillus massiliensis]